MGLLQLTEDELLCVLAACIEALASPGPLEDAEDKENIGQLRDATVKLAKSVGMDRDTLAEFAMLAAGGKPSAELIRALEQRKGPG